MGIYVSSFIDMCTYDESKTSLSNHTPNQYSTKLIYHFFKYSFLNRAVRYIKNNTKLAFIEW